MSQKPPPPGSNPDLRKLFISDQVEYLDNMYAVMESLTPEAQAGVLARAGYSEEEYHAIMRGEGTWEGLGHIADALIAHFDVTNVGSPPHAILRMLRHKVDPTFTPPRRKIRKSRNSAPPAEKPAEAAEDAQEAPTQTFRPAHKAYIANIGFALESMTPDEQVAVLARAGHSRDEYVAMMEGRADPLGLDDVTDALATHFGVSWDPEKDTPNRVADKIRRRVIERTPAPAENVIAPSEEPAEATADTKPAEGGEALAEMSDGAADALTASSPGPQVSEALHAPPVAAEVPPQQVETGVSDAYVKEFRKVDEIHMDHSKRLQIGAALKKIRGGATPQQFVDRLKNDMGGTVSQYLTVGSYRAFEGGAQIAALAIYDILRAFNPDIDLAVAEIQRQAAAITVAAEGSCADFAAPTDFAGRLRFCRDALTRIEETAPIWWHLSHSLPEKLAPAKNKPARMEASLYEKLRDKALDNVLAARMKCTDEVFVKLYDRDGEPMSDLKRMPVSSLFRQKGSIIYYHPDAIRCGAITADMVEAEMIRLTAQQITRARAKAAAQMDAVPAPPPATGDVITAELITAKAPDVEAHLS